jgi:DNA-binding SARP family transcriptional activator
MTRDARPERETVVASVGFSTATRGHPRPPAVRLRLLGSFDLEIGHGAVELQHSAQRLLALLALRPYALQRPFLAGCLWLDAPERRAAANLRSVVWRIRQLGYPILVVGRGTLRLDPGVMVDISGARESAYRWLTGQPTTRDVALASSPLRADVLPDWYEDWVVDERDQFRQLRLHALEEMTQRLLSMNRYGEALVAALEAAREDPLRESAQRALIEVHLAEGNTGEALRQLRRCEQIFQRELGLRPSRQLADRVRQAVTTAAEAGGG